MSDQAPAPDSPSRLLDRRVPAALLLAVGAAVLAASWPLESWMDSRRERAAADVEAASVARDDQDAEIAERQALRDVVAKDIAQAKRNAASLTRSRRAVFEGGLAVSEEKRLLEKQWEIMTTYLLVDPANDRVQVMRGDQAYETWPLGGNKPRAVGGDKHALPKLATIVSKERYAHTERGKSEQVGGRLDWEPPQVGTSVRASALGESVMFTKEGLVLHGAPLKTAEHESYPHLCLTLPTATARRLYSRSFIGTRILIAPAPVPAAPRP